MANMELYTSLFETYDEIRKNCGDEICEIEIDVGVILIKACETGNLELAQFMIARGATYFCQEGLQYACANGHLKLVQLMISQNANIRFDAPFQAACENGHFEIVKWVVEHGIYNNVIGFNNGLSSAFLLGHTQIAQLLIEKGANNYNQILTNACMNGRINLAKLMIDYGADNFNYGLQMACITNNLQIAKLMIEHDANVNESVYETTNLHIIRLLCEYGVQNVRIISPRHKPYIDAYRNKDIQTITRYNKILSAENLKHHIYKKSMIINISCIFPFDISQNIVSFI